MSKQELVGWLQQQIAEQTRIDLSTSGVPVFPEGMPGNIPIKPTKETASPTSDVQLMLPVDAKKQRKRVKQLFFDRGSCVCTRIE